MGSRSSFNISDPEARVLAAELSKLTGESVSEAVTVALRERLEHKRHERAREAPKGDVRGSVAARLLEIGRRAAALPVLDPREPDDILYDEHGLPK